MIVELTGDQISNFWKKVPVGSNDSCWNWKASLSNKGYGEFRIHPKGKQKAHRISWILTFGQIPNGLFVCHKCDNPACVNPYHLFLGTATDNMRDMYAKGRGWMPKGELNPKAKLTSGQVVQIRNLYEEGLTQVKIASMFGVTQGMIGFIVRGEAWK